jgi:hypothetical protein
MRKPPKASDGLQSLVALAEENGWAVQLIRDGYEFTRDGDECQVRAEEHTGRIYYARLGPFAVLSRDRQAQLRAYVNSPPALMARRVAEYAAEKERQIRDRDGVTLLAAVGVLASYEVDLDLTDALAKVAEHIRDGHTPRKA